MEEARTAIRRCSCLCLQIRTTFCQHVMEGMALDMLLHNGYNIFFFVLSLGFLSLQAQWRDKKKKL